MEISLKLHLCGGDLLEVPCSRISHTFRSHHNNHGIEGVDVVANNFKRIAEVWLDDFKEVMYRADPERFAKADAGDLTKALLVKQKLKCKPFAYFLDKIVPEMYTRFYYQRDFPGYFAQDAVRSDKFPTQCITWLEQPGKPLLLSKCENENLNKPPWSQNFRLTWHKKFRVYNKEECLADDTITAFCHYSGHVAETREQDWKFNMDTKQLISYSKEQCLTAANKTSLALAPCNALDPAQKWTWGSLNETALLNYEIIRFEHHQFLGFDEL